MRFEKIRDQRQFNPGFDADATVRHLIHYSHLLREIVHLHLAWLPRVPHYDVKCLLGIHVYEDANFICQLHQRLAEFHHSPNNFHAPNPKIDALLDWLNTLDSWEDYVICVYNALKPRLIDEWENHFLNADPLIDEPTTRLLADLLRVTSEHIKGGMSLVETVMSQSTPLQQIKTRRNLEHIRTLWQEMKSVPTGLPLDFGKRRQLSPKKPLSLPERDEFCQVTTNGDPKVNPDINVKGLEAVLPQDPANLPNFIHAQINLELATAELCATSSHENPHLPWEFHRDMARQVWDEVRHAQILEKFLNGIGAQWGDFPIDHAYFTSLKAKELPYRLLNLNGPKPDDSDAAGKDRWERIQQLAAKETNTQTDYRKLNQILEYFSRDEAWHHEIARKWAEKLKN